MQEREKLYTDYLQEIAKRELSGSESYDKAVLTLSSAGLGLSVTLLKDVVQLDNAIFLPVLYLSWLMFIVAIGSTIVSFLMSAKALSHQKVLAARFYREGDEDAFSEDNPYDNWTRLLNYLSGATFGLALLLTPAFVVLNLEFNPMSTNKSLSASTLEQRGLPVPTMQRPSPAPPPPTKQ